MNDINEQNIRHRRFVSSVVYQAILDHQYNVKEYGEEKAMMMEPAKWILSCSDREYGFDWCCYFLQLSPDKLRSVMNTTNLVEIAKMLSRRLPKKQDDSIEIQNNVVIDFSDNSDSDSDND